MSTLPQNFRLSRGLTSEWGRFQSSPDIDLIIRMLGIAMILSLLRSESLILYLWHLFEQMRPIIPSLLALTFLTLTRELRTKKVTLAIFHKVYAHRLCKSVGTSVVGVWGDLRRSLMQNLERRSFLFVCVAFLAFFLLVVLFLLLDQSHFRHFIIRYCAFFFFNLAFLRRLIEIFELTLAIFALYVRWRLLIQCLSHPDIRIVTTESPFLIA